MADGLDFSPLSDGERDAAAQDGASRNARLRRNQPCGAGGLPCRAANADGEPAFFVFRWNKPDGEKEIRPLSWFAGEGWRFRAWPDARPLYRLDGIAAEPDALIVICEGEKAADAAAMIFPQSITTTSSGGAQATAKTDWAPLAGRSVLIWPDNDDPGRKYVLACLRR